VAKQVSIVGRTNTSEYEKTITIKIQNNSDHDIKNGQILVGNVFGPTTDRLQLVEDVKPIPDGKSWKKTIDLIKDEGKGLPLIIIELYGENKTFTHSGYIHNITDKGGTLELTLVSN
jgi:hypothetical protein